MEKGARSRVYASRPSGIRTVPNGIIMHLHSLCRHHPVESRGADLSEFKKPERLELASVSRHVT